MIEQVMKWLKCCSYSNDGEGCDDCPYNYETGCIGQLTADTLDILANLQKENESLKAELGAAQQAINSMKAKLKAAGLYHG